MNIRGEYIDLLDYVVGNKLIFRYSELNCSTCIDAQIQNLNEFAKLIGVHNILLLTTYQNDIYMQRFRKVNKIKFEILNIDQDSVLADIGVPYFFILTSKEMRIQSMFIPQKEEPKLTYDYLQLIREKYFL